MKNTFIRIAFVLALFGGLVGGLHAQDKASSPTSGFLADYDGQITMVQKQLLDLEGAVPQDKFTWRPMEGVRAVGEVYLHTAFGSYIILKLAGFEPPAEANFVPDLKKWDAQTTDKAKIASIMKRAFEFVHGVAAKATTADLEKKVNIFGTEMTLRGALMVSLSHLHEHLGQSIAYARMNGVVPPWTAAEQKAEAEKAKK